MSGGSMGSLVVDISANVAHLQSDMNKGVGMVQEAMTKIDKAAKVAAEAFVGLFAFEKMAQGLDSLRESISSTIEATAALSDMAVKTGSLVENLSSLADISKLSGTDTQTLSSGLEHLSKSMADAQAGGTLTSGAFKALGISTKNLQDQKPDQLFLEIAKSLQGYADGASKVAVVQGIFGRSGAELLPVLKDLATQGGYVRDVTKQQSDSAKEYEDDLKRLDVASTAVTRTFAMQITPAMDVFTKAMIDAITGTDGLQSSADKLSKDGSIQEWALKAAQSVALVIDAFEGLARTFETVGHFFGALMEEEDKFAQLNRAIVAGLTGITTPEKFIAGIKGTFAGIKSTANDFKNDMDEILGRVSFGDRLKKEIEDMRRKAAMTGSFGVVGDPGDTRTKLNFDPLGKGAGNAAAQEQAALKELQSFINSEDKLLVNRNKALDLYYNADKISITDYFDDKRIILEANLKDISAAYDKEIAAVQKYLVSTSDVAKRASATAELHDLEAKKADAAADASSKLGEINAQQAVATNKYSDSVAGLTAELDKLEGRLNDSSVAAFKAKFGPLLDRSKLEGNAPQVQSQYDRGLADVSAQAQVAEQIARSKSLQEDLASSENALQLKHQTGQLSDLELMGKQSDARIQAAKELEDVAAKYDQIAAASGNPKLIADAKAFQQQIDAMAASADVLGQKFNTIFEDQFGKMFADVIDGSKRFKAAFSDMAKSIDQQISQMVAKSLTQKLFGDMFADSKGGTGGGGPGGFIASILGLTGGSKSGGGGGSGDYAGFPSSFLPSSGAQPAANTADGIYASIFGKSASDDIANSLKNSGNSSGGILGSLFGDVSQFLSKMGSGASSAVSDVASSAGSGLGGIVTSGASWLSSLGGLADGGTIGPGGMAQVNENGPELLSFANKTYLMMDSQTGTVTPLRSQAGASGNSVNIGSINVPSGTSRASASQIATQVAARLQLEYGRNG